MNAAVTIAALARNRIDAAMPFDIDAIRKEFPSLAVTDDGKPRVYFDNPAGTQVPRRVIDAISDCLLRANANLGGYFSTTRLAGAIVEEAHAAMRDFLNARDAGEILYGQNSTSLVLHISRSIGREMAAGDEIVLTRMDHDANVGPWLMLAEDRGLTVKWWDFDTTSWELDFAQLDTLLTPRTKLVAVNHASNALGTITDVAEVARRAHAVGAWVFVDAVQSAPHMALDVQALGCDFLACSGHKVLGPMGTGVLWARQATLDALPPYHLGSNMAHEVAAASAQFEHGALKYQAGTPDVAGAIGLAAAVDVLDRFDLAAIRRHDAALVEHARRAFAAVPRLRVLGTMADRDDRLPVFTFVLPGVAVSRLVAALDAEGIAVRGGDMAALPLLRRFGVAEAVRVSAYLYTTTDEIDRMADVLRHESGRG
jgi:cysteine desulfurase family protein (TIGR01976 family)